MMKITGGVYRSRNIKTPKGEATRPTSAMLREVIFNIFSNEIRDSRVLDLFAGSGSVGIEALSRGAASAVFVENNRTAANIIKENIVALGIDKDVALVLPVTVKASIEKFKREGTVFDFIFIDPPFADINAYTESLDGLAAVLADDGTIIAQHDKKVILAEEYTGLIQSRTKIIGDNTLSFYKNYKFFGKA